MEGGDHESSRLLAAQGLAYPLFISRAALLVKVTAAMLRALQPHCCTR